MWGALKSVFQVAIAFIVLVLIFPWFDNPMRYVHWQDKLRALPIGMMVAGEPCTTEVSSMFRGEETTLIVGNLHSPDCVRFGPVKRFKGIWNNEFEGSRFIPVEDKDYSPEEYADLMFSRSGIWIDVPNETLRKSPNFNPKRYGIYVVKFNGRQTLVKGGYGHFGMSDHLVLADEIISFETIMEPDAE